MAIRKKLITIAFLSLGFIVIAVGILRLVWLTNKFKGKTHSYSVEQSYSALECNIAIIGASGPTVKYLLSSFIPSLRSDSHKNHASYGNSGSNGIASRTRSKFNSKAYNDLETVTAQHEEFEMKQDWRWRHKNDSDGNSDEQRITENEGIVKTVDWTVSNTDMAYSPPTTLETRHATQPKAVV